MICHSAHQCIDKEYVLHVGATGGGGRILEFWKGEGMGAPIINSYNYVRNGGGSPKGGGCERREGDCTLPLLVAIRSKCILISNVPNVLAGVHLSTALYRSAK